MINWDHPDIIRWDDLIHDIQRLKHGESFIIKTKDRHDNPDYATHRQAVDRGLKPLPFLFVEGYLTLYNPKLRALFDKTFFLDISHADRMRRRDKGRLVGGDEYVEKVLVPMHEKYVEPTKAFADVVIDVSSMSVDEVKQKLLADLA
jgi:uridine kinase